MKITGIVLGSVILLIAVSLFLFRVFSPAYVIPYVIQQVEEETNGRYTLSVNSDSLKIRFISMTVRLGQTEFKRDTTVNAYTDIPFLNKFDVDATFKSFNIHALNMLRYAFSKKIVIDEISLIKPSIVIRKNREYVSELHAEKIDSEVKVDSVRLEHNYNIADTLAWDEFKESGGFLLPHLKIDHFSIEDAYFSFYDGEKPYPIHEITGLTFDIEEFNLIKNSDIEISDGSISINSVSSLVSKNTARLSLQGVKLQPGNFHIDSLHFGHIVDKYRINEIKGFRASWINVGVKDIDIAGIHPGKFVSDSTIIIDKASVGKVNFNLFKDKKDPVINPAHKALPQELIRSISIGVRIDTIDILDADLIIDMEAPTADKPGQIILNQTNVRISNLTNIPSNLEEDPIMQVQASTKIMNQIPLTINYKLKIDSPTDQFWASIHTTPFDLSILNGFVGSQFFMEFKSGHVDKMEFSFEGNNKANVGEMDFEYTKLKVQKLHGHERYLEGRPKTGFFASVGNMLIPTNRSASQKSYKPAAIYYEKEYNRDIIHGTIMSLVSGVLSSLGFSSKNLEKQQRKAAELDETATQKSAEVARGKAEKAEHKKKEAEQKETKKHEKELKKQEKKEQN